MTMYPDVPINTTNEKFAELVVAWRKLINAHDWDGAFSVQLLLEEIGAFLDAETGVWSI